jgi:hypothetical protein
MTLPIPTPDPIPLPASGTLLEILLVGTFILHLVPMNLVLGGAPLALWSALRAAGSPEHARLARWWARLLPVAMALTITSGVAPLLFLQVLYGPFFFSSSILMAWPWLGILPLLLLAYYGFYWYSLQFEALGRQGALVAAGSVACVIAIGFLFTSNLVLMLQPEKWRALYARSWQGLAWNATDPIVLPRFLHFFLAALAVAGFAVFLLGVRRRQSDPGFGDWVARLGARWFVGATLVQILVGPWILLSVPEPVRPSFLGGRMTETTLLIGGIGLGILAVLLVLVRRPGGATTALGGTLALMAITRDRIRAGSLAPYYSPQAREVEPQTVAVILFFVVLVLGLVSVGWMVSRLFRSVGSHT